MRFSLRFGVVGLMLATFGFNRFPVQGEDRSRPGAGEFPTRMIKIGPDERRYRLVVPTSVNLQRESPLVIAFHGILIDSKDLMPRYTRLNETAHTHQFLIAYPDAIDRSWGLAPDKISRDLRFFDAILKDIKSDYRIDPDRIYVVGMSNGGYFAHLVGRERSEEIAAVASHSGPLGLQTLSGINAKRKFPVLIIHGTEDRLFPVDIARENHAKYRREGHPAQYEEISGQGHLWAHKANINETLWTFFQQHPRRQ